MFDQKLAFACAMLIALSFGCSKNDSASSSTATPSASSSGSGAPAGSPAGGAATPTDNLVKISQYGGSLYCSIASGSDGTLHAIYTDRADATKVMYLFYRSSKDGGATWSDPKNLSDDESGLSSYYCRCVVDGKGRVYAIWKYLTAASDSLDGPGSACCGIIAYRCLEGGSWSKVVRFCDKHVPATSYFAAVAPDGAVNVVWAQGNKEIDWVPMGGVQCQNANLIQQTVLDGSTMGASKGLIVPKPIPTQAQIDAAHAAGKDIPYEDQHAKYDGLWNLRGYVDSAGVAHFVGEHYSVRDANGNSSKEFFVEWDGKQVHKLYEVDSGIDMDNPPTLLIDAHGQEHLIKMPEHTEKECVRDYPIKNFELGDPIDVIAPDKAPGKVVDWQATQLTNGKLAVTCALSQKGGWDPDDVELYISTDDGNGKWSPATDITNNAARAAFMSKQTAAGGVMKSDQYTPDFAESVALKDGGLGVLMVNTDKAIIGITQSGVTASGQSVGALSTGSTSAPWVFFRKL